MHVAAADEAGRQQIASNHPHVPPLPSQPPLNPAPRTEKLDKMTAADMAALGKEFCAQTVDKLQHAGDLWLLNADDASTLMDAVIESFRIQDQHVRGAACGMWRYLSLRGAAPDHACSFGWPLLLLLSCTASFG